MKYSPRLLAGLWFALAGALASLGVAALAGFPGEPQRHNLIAYASAGVIAAFFWGSVLGGRLLAGDRAPAFWGAGAAGGAVALLSLFSVGTVSALGLAVAELCQGEFALAWERVVVALPAGLALGLWASVLVGWIVVPVGVAAGVLLDLVWRRAKRT